MVSSVQSRCQIIIMFFLNFNFVLVNSKNNKNELSDDLIAKSEGAEYDKKLVVEEEKIEPSLQKSSPFKEDSDNIKKQKNDLLLLKQTSDYHFYCNFMDIYL